MSGLWKDVSASIELLFQLRRKAERVRGRVKHSVSGIGSREIGNCGVEITALRELLRSRRQRMIRKGGSRRYRVRALRDDRVFGENRLKIRMRLGVTNESREDIIQDGFFLLVGLTHLRFLRHDDLQVFGGATVLNEQPGGEGEAHHSESEEQLIRLAAQVRAFLFELGQFGIRKSVFWFAHILTYLFAGRFRRGIFARLCAN